VNQHRRSIGVVTQCRKALLLCVGLVWCTLIAAQGAYPTRPIRLVVPFPAGGATDLLARAISQRASQTLGQSIVVDNRAGASGVIGSAEVAKSPPDGYTLLVATSSTHSIGPELNASLPYHVETDFTPIAHVADAPSLVLVPNTLPVNSVKELIEYAKARPGRLNYASSGNGTVVHLMTEAFKEQAGVYIVHVPYRGTALAIPDLVSDKTQLLFDSVVSGMPHVKAGRLKALAVTSAKRTSLAPDLPTLGESGLPGYEATAWFGIYAPRGLPTELVNRLNAEFVAAVQSPEVRDRLERLGAEPASANTPAQFAAMVQLDRRRWARVIKERHISPE